MFFAFQSDNKNTWTALDVGPSTIAKLKKMSIYIPYYRANSKFTSVDQHEIFYHS